MRQALMPAATLCIALTCSPAHAHHSHFYDECKTTTIEGQVESAAFKNPHNSIVLRLDDGTAFAVDWVQRDLADEGRPHRCRERRGSTWGAHRGDRSSHQGCSVDPQI
jgi:hypothetical protein